MSGNIEIQRMEIEPEEGIRTGDGKQISQRYAVFVSLSVAASSHAEAAMTVERRLTGE